MADIGAGTGIHTGGLVDCGWRVMAIEPNPAMRSLAEDRFEDEPSVIVVDGSAEDTTLPDGSVAAAFAAQAFHWFDHESFRTEVERVVTPGGAVALVWNVRDRQGNPFTTAYEAFLDRWGGSEYQRVRSGWAGESAVASFYGGSVERSVFQNPHPVDWDGLSAMAGSSSYLPADGHPDRIPSQQELRRIFDDFAVEGEVTIAYETVLFSGRLG